MGEIVPALVCLAITVACAVLTVLDDRREAHEARDRIRADRAARERYEITKDWHDRRKKEKQQ